VVKQKFNLKFPCKCGYMYNDKIHCTFYDDEDIILNVNYFPCYYFPTEKHCWIPDNLKYLETLYESRTGRA
jgi:hypothetical protein